MKNDIPKISVLTYVYCSKEDRRLEYLLEAIDSVKNQNFDENYEHVIVDDGSDVDIEDIVKDRNCFIRFIKKDHEGIAKSFIRALQEARGEYSIILASDDIFTNLCFSTLSNYLDSNKEVGVIAGKTMYWDGKADLKLAPFEADYDEKLLLKRNIIGGCSAMFRTKYLKEINLPSVKSGIAIDYDLWLRLSEVCKIESTNFIVSKYRLHKTNYQKKSVKNMKKRTREINYAISSAKRRRKIS